MLMFDVVLTAGGGSKLTRVAENTVWHTHALPSHIVLPVVTKSPVIFIRFFDFILFFTKTYFFFETFKPVPPQFVPVAEVLPTFQDDSKSDDDSDGNNNNNDFQKLFNFLFFKT